MSETGFLIDGRTYPVPGIPDMDMDELQVVYEACGITLQGWALRESDDPEERREWAQGVANPKWMTCLLHIAYQRGNPQVPAEVVAKLVAKVKWLDATSTLTAEEPEEPEEPETPLAEEIASGRSSSTGQPSRPISSGESSLTSQTGLSTSSDEPGAEHATTGTTGSDGPSTSVPLRQVV